MTTPDPAPDAATATPPARPARYQGLIQPIVVRRSGTHEQMVEAAARASVAAWLTAPDHPAWQPWLAAAFAKTVRRARPAEIEKIRPYAVASAAVGDAEAFALVPHDTGALPREVAKLQVSGLNAERTDDWGVPTDRFPRLLINLDAQMTTGKTCAQAAHGIFGWALRQDPDTLTVWQRRGLPFTLGVFHDELRFDGKVVGSAVEELSAEAAVVIQDNGHTEVAPNTTTVLVFNPNPAWNRS